AAGVGRRRAAGLRPGRRGRWGGGGGVGGVPLPGEAAAAAGATALLPDGAGPLVGLAPGSAWATKRWTAEGFAAVLRAVRAEGARVVVLGALAERSLAEEVVRLGGGGATVLAGRTDLATLVAVVDRLALLVANDSPPLHP